MDRRSFLARAHGAVARPREDFAKKKKAVISNTRAINLHTGVGYTYTKTSTRGRKNVVTGHHNLRLRGAVEARILICTN